MSVSYNVHNILCTILSTQDSNDSDVCTTIYVTVDLFERVIDRSSLVKKKYLHVLILLILDMWSEIDAFR